ncbi:MAG: hypothetical protein J6Y62_01905 [Clostridia bacterium]|nr:hypothetical protein [Clostridia bacterium]
MKEITAEYETLEDPDSITGRADAVCPALLPLESCGNLISRHWFPSRKKYMEEVWRYQVSILGYHYKLVEIVGEKAQKDLSAWYVFEGPVPSKKEYEDWLRAESEENVLYVGATADKARAEKAAGKLAEQGIVKDFVFSWMIKVDGGTPEKIMDKLANADPGVLFGDHGRALYDVKRPGLNLARDRFSVPDEYQYLLEHMKGTGKPFAVAEFKAHAARNRIAAPRPIFD